jgi:RNA polymerase sigma-32 factor
MLQTPLPLLRPFLCWFARFARFASFASFARFARLAMRHGQEWPIAPRRVLSQISHTNSHGDEAQHHTRATFAVELLHNPHLAEEGAVENTHPSSLLDRSVSAPASPLRSATSVHGRQRSFLRATCAACQFGSFFGSRCRLTSPVLRPRFEATLPRTTKQRPTSRSQPRPERPTGNEPPARRAERKTSPEPPESAQEETKELDPDATLEPDGDEALAEKIESSAEELDGDGVPRPQPKAATSTGPIERFDALSTYLREVQRHPLLSAEETQTLAVKFLETQDPALAARLVTANLRLVVKIAYEYRRAYKNIMDLIQEGNIGLMQAVKRYDPYRGVKLSSYAAWWIRAYILRFILNNWRLVKLGTTQAQRKLFFNLRKKRAELQSLGIDPTNAEIARQLNVPESEVEEMEVRLQSSEKSLDAPIGDSEGRAIAKIDMMPSSIEGPEALMADGELQALLKERLARFRKTLAGKDKEMAIFDERLVADEPLTLQELGDRFGISRERVRQLEQRLTGKLREFLREELGDAVEVA